MKYLCCNIFQSNKSTNKIHKTGRTIMQYFENPYFEQGKDTLILKQMDWNSKKYAKTWDRFFK